ncbi:MAG: hypothetical protein OEZ04_08115 [Nitrospinota bacterium]|nr:hypothetical protein [Nitrospinota bacterium]
MNKRKRYSAPFKAKYGSIYLNAYETGSEARAGIGKKGFSRIFLALNLALVIRKTYSATD